jgi:Sulfotransferase family
MSAPEPRCAGKAHPELASQQVTRPVFIVGIPRSGTTALSHLLARDRRHRSLLSWEATASTPPPAAATYDSDPRYLAAIQHESDFYAVNPGFKAIHHDPPDMPVECLVILAQHFANLSFGTMYHVDGYLDWILDADLEPAYRWHKRLLQLLQSDVPGRWVLKGPQHALFLDTIVKVYPDARFIVTHRDPVICVGSTASLTASLTGTFSEQERRVRIGERWSDILATMVARTMSFRARHGDDRFIDVSYKQLVHDPIAVVRRIYDALGEELTSGTEHAMRLHVSEHRQHRYGRHSYKLSDFGLDATNLERRFADYTRSGKASR